MGKAEAIEALERALSDVKSITDRPVHEEHVGTDYGTALVVADRGFVYVGDVFHHLDTGTVQVSRAKNVRVWGTTKGLGELVGGPTSKTVMDAVGTVHVPWRAVISIIPVEADKWNSTLA